MIAKTKVAPTKLRYTGILKWYNVKLGYGFITCLDDGKDVFVHRGEITKWNQARRIPSLEEGEDVEFGIRGTSRLRATQVTGPGGTRVRGSPYVRTRRLQKRNNSTTKERKPELNTRTSEPRKNSEAEAVLSVLPFQGDSTNHGPGNGHPLSPRGKEQRIPHCPFSSAKSEPQPSTSA